MKEMSAKGLFYLILSSAGQKRGRALDKDYLKTLFPSMVISLFSGGQREEEMVNQEMCENEKRGEKSSKWITA